MSKDLERDRSRQLRHDSTDAERKLWSRLRDAQLGYKFRRQHQVGPYFADFCCIARRLIVELDGGHHQEQEAYDARRTEYLTQVGFRVLRFWNADVLNQTDGVVAAILEALTQTQKS